MNHFITRVPKVELHVHLVGALPLQFIEREALQSGVDGIQELLTDISRAGRYRGPEHFGEVYQAVNGLIRTEEDVARAVVEVARTLADQNVRYAEVAVTPGNHLRSGVGRDDLIAGLRAGRESAEALTDVTIRWCMAASGRDSPREAENALEIALEMGKDVVSFGLGGPEIPRLPFKSIFREAKRSGLRIAPHAGERLGPEEVWAALLDLGADRIGHGIRSIEDPHLVDYLREKQVPLEICPTSNVMTGLASSIARHPVKRLMDAGLHVTISSDDPTLFGTSLSNEYRSLVQAFGLTRSEIQQLLQKSIAAAFVDDLCKQRMLEELAVAVAADDE